MFTFQEDRTFSLANPSASEAMSESFVEDNASDMFGSNYNPWCWIYYESMGANPRCWMLNLMWSLIIFFIFFTFFLNLILSIQVDVWTYHKCWPLNLTVNLMWSIERWMIIFCCWISLMLNMNDVNNYVWWRKLMLNGDVHSIPTDMLNEQALV